MVVCKILSSFIIPWKPNSLTNTLLSCRFWVSRKPHHKMKWRHDGELCLETIILIKLKDRKRRDVKLRKNSWRFSKRTKFCRKRRIADNDGIVVPTNKSLLINLRNNKRQRDRKVVHYRSLYLKYSIIINAIKTHRWMIRHLFKQPSDNNCI